MQPLDECACHCPYCGEPISLLVDLSAGSQSYIEDCQICCRPIHINLWVDPDQQGYQLNTRCEDDVL